MAAPRAHLDKAPIVEAVIDVRVLARDGLSVSDLKRATDFVGAEYTAPTPMRSLHARFGVESGKPVLPAPVEAEMGWAFKCGSAEKPTAVAQFRTNGFTFNKLEPYTTWGEVFGEADRLWRVYVEVARPREVTRLAVRYINRMRRPNPGELREYLEAAPTLPAQIPQLIQEFLTRVVVYDAERDASVVITQALETPVDPGFISVLLDIDAFRYCPLPPSDPSMPRIFETLRGLKNAIFYGSITEKTAEMFA